MFRSYQHAATKVGLSLTLSLTMALGIGVSLAAADTVNPLGDSDVKQELTSSINLTEQVVDFQKNLAPIQGAKSGAATGSSGTNVSVPQERFAPAIYNNTVAWAEKIGEDYEICVAEVTDGQVQYYYQATQDDLDQAYPSIYENKIVWDVNQGGKRSIVLFNHSANSAERKSTVFSSAYSDTDPHIYGNRIVFQRKLANGSREIMLYELDANNAITKTTQITNNLADDINPVIYGDTIVWQRKNPGTGWDLYKYEIGQSKVNGEVVYQGNGDQVFPSIGGYTDNGALQLKVVWEDWRDTTKSQIYYHVLGTTKFETVVASNTIQIDPITSNGDVVWAELGNNGNWKIRMFIAKSAKNPKKSVVETVSDDKKMNHYFPALHLGSVVWTAEDKLGQENIYIMNP